VDRTLLYDDDMTQPWAGKGLSENKVFISGDMGEDDVVPLAVELIPLEVD